MHSELTSTKDRRANHSSAAPTRSRWWLVTASAGAAVLALAACSSSPGTPAATTGSRGTVARQANNGTTSSQDRLGNPAGVTIRFADQLKDIQTIVMANNALQGAPYSVDWSQFTAGPPIVAAETGGSVDLGVMAETPTIFAQAAGDPIEVVAVSEGSPESTPFSIVVAPSSAIRSVSQLRGKTVAVQEGTTEQYILVRALQEAGLPYSSVRIDNLNIVAGEAALESGRVDAYVTSEPLTSLMVEAGKGRVLPGGSAGTHYLQYITASRSALANPDKRAAIVDLITRIFKAETDDAKNPTQGVQTYVKTYGVPLAVAQRAAASVSILPAAISPSTVEYQQQEADTFQQLGLIPNHIDVNGLFDRTTNQQIMAAWNAARGGS
ncbi:MAG: aliphatic sulfonate ABC transporter substrate-binding protein [Actinomycetota bacterium]|nr:aliphatic sulfonate ABC transporter substrate-binding protein [Actinomycetota bacterium]